MQDWFAIEHLDVERLLAQWRWLCRGRVRLVARNAFADLFLCDQTGRVFLLDVAIGKLTKVADSEAQFRDLVRTEEKRAEWFAESDELSASARGLRPNANECIGFSIPLVLSKGVSPNPPYVVDLYEHVSFLGDLNRQVADLPNGAKVRLRVKR